MCTLTDSFILTDLIFMKSLIKFSAVVCVPHFPRNSHYPEEPHSFLFFCLLSVTPPPPDWKDGKVGGVKHKKMLIC